MILYFSDKPNVGDPLPSVAYTGHSTHTQVCFVKEPQIGMILYF